MKPMFDGPIPGENYTSDTKNYPWHRPPDITDYDEAVEFVIRDLSNPSRISMIYTMMEAGQSIAGIVSIVNMLNIGNGKYSVDLSILIAGPIARFLEIAAKENGIEANLGTPEEEIYTLEMFRAMQGVSDNADEPPVEPPAAPPADGGLMAMGAETDAPADPDTQAAMLGLNEEDA
jgi:hypothetical protein